MSKTSVQPFSQYINWFKLKINEGQIFKIPTFTYVDKPAEYFIEHDEQYYSLEQLRGYQPVQPDNIFLRRIILKGFKDALAKNNFSFKGARQDIAFWHKKAFPQPHNDIFSLYTASFEFRVASYFTGETDEFYLVINPHLVFSFNEDIEALKLRGVSESKLVNHSVRVLLDEGGQISGIDSFLLEVYNAPEKGMLCRVIDSRDGAEQSFAAKQVYLEPRPEIINSILKELGSKYDVIRLQREQSFLKSQTASRDRLNKTKNIVKFLREDAEIFPLSVGEFNVEISPEPLAVGGSGFPRISQLVEPTLLFDKSDSSATHLQAYWGLRNFGPYTKDLPVIKVALLGSKPGVQQLEMMVKQMNRGTSIMPDGVRRFYYTKLESIDTEIVNESTVEAYVQGAEKIAAKAEKRGRPDVVLVQIEKTSDFDLETPYYYVKPVLLAHNLPSQMVTPQALANAQWIHGNIGNAIFAKAHGYPWVLAQDMPEFDMIMGVALSQAISKTKRAGARPRHLGYANVFDELGRWMFFESTSLIYDSEKHEEQLAQLVELSINKYQRIKDEAPKNIAVHYYKRFGRREKEMVINALDKKIKDYRIAFITIDKSHPMRLYDLHNQDGSFSRARYAQLSETEFLLCTTGVTELGKKRLGTPLILKVSFDQYPDTFVSLENIASQILALTRLNYKTLSPIVGEPVTLLFANLVANFMAVFSEGQWKTVQEDQTSKLHTVPWFL